MEDFANPGAFKSSPTIAAGDFKVDKDAGGLTNLSTLPSVSPAASVLVLITLSSTEMNADVVTLVGIDQTSPKEWADFVLCIQTTQANDLSAAQINAEVVDALNVDTYAEPGQEAPPATTTLQKKISYLYKVMRNKITQTVTTLSVFADDASTVDQKATVTDDGTTYTRGEIGTGP